MQSSEPAAKTESKAELPATPSKPTARIAIAEARDALLRSGYLLESRLETALRKHAFYVETNVAYPDPETAKARELDVYALNAFHSGPSDFDYIFEVLLIECINNPQPMAFITKSPLNAHWYSSEVRLAGIPAKIPHDKAPGNWISIRDYLEMQKYHHYCRGRIATQFCSFVQKKGTKDWMATHEDSHFDAFKKLSAVTDHFVERQYRNWAFARRSDEVLNLEFYYPVVVLQGTLIEASPSRKGLTIRETDHIQYRRSGIIGTEPLEYQIDVVTERYFSRFLRIVNKEMSRTARLLKKRHVEIRKAIDHVWRAARRFKAPEKIRGAMAFD